LRIREEFTQGWDNSKIEVLEYSMEEDKLQQPRFAKIQ